MAEDRKFKFEDGKFINRISGEAIPDDEPVIIFRARDWHSLEVLEKYLSLIQDAHHIRAVQETMDEFIAYQNNNPGKLKEPGVTREMFLKQQGMIPNEPDSSKPG